MAPWERLIRFEDQAGTEQIGEPIIRGDDVSSLDELVAGGKLEAKCMIGSNIFALSASTNVAKVKNILALLSPSQVPLVKCVGLNYMEHSQCHRNFPLP